MDKRLLELLRDINSDRIDKWKKAALELGELSLIDSQAKIEIEKGIVSDITNMRRHFNLSFLMMYAKSNECFQIKVKDIEYNAADYAYELLLSDKSIINPLNKDDAFLKKTLLYGIGFVIVNKKYTFNKYSIETLRDFVYSLLTEKVKKKNVENFRFNKECIEQLCSELVVLKNIIKPNELEEIKSIIQELLLDYRRYDQLPFQSLLFLKNIFEINKTLENPKLPKEFEGTKEDGIKYIQEHTKLRYEDNLKRCIVTLQNIKKSLEEEITIEEEEYLIYFAYEYFRNLTPFFMELKLNKKLNVQEEKEQIIKKIYNENMDFIEFFQTTFEKMKLEINNIYLFYEKFYPKKVLESIQNTSDIGIKSFNLYKLFFLKSLQEETGNKSLELIKNKLLDSKSNEMKKFYIEQFKLTFYDLLNKEKKFDNRNRIILSTTLFITKYILHIQTVEDMYIKPVSTMIAESLKESKENTISAYPDQCNIHDIFYKIIYRISSFNPHESIYEKMLEYLIFEEEITKIVTMLYNLKDFQACDFNKSSNEYSYIIEGLKIYPFNCEYNLKLAKNLIKNIAVEKRIVELYYRNEITDENNQEMFFHVLNGVSKDIDIELSNLCENIFDLQTNREDLNKNIKMNLNERIRLIQKNLNLLNEIAGKIKDLLPKNLYYIHEKFCNAEEYNYNLELEFVYKLKEKNENFLMEEIKKYQNKELTELDTMKLALVYDYSSSSFQWYMFKDIKLLFANVDFKSLDIDLNSNVAFTRGGFIKGLLLSMGFGYLAPFLLGANTEFWDYYKNQQLLSMLLLNIAMIVFCYLKIVSIIEHKVGQINKKNIYSNFNIIKRRNIIFIQSLLTSIFFSTIGLLVYAPVGISGFNWFDLNGYVTNWVTIVKYLCTFPLVGMFIGLYMENKLED